MPERNALADNTIEASECLKAWWDRGLITQVRLQGSSEVTGPNGTST
jgi:hypothetical protein